MSRIYVMGCCAVVAASWLGLGVSAAELERPVRYSIAATSGVTLSLPVAVGKGQHLYRDARGKWSPLPNVREEAGVVTFTLSAEQMAGGQTIVLLGKPDWLIADDSAPPELVGVTIDKRSVTPSKEMNLGWLDAAPETIELQVADALNPLDPASVCATVSGRTVRPGAAGFEFQRDPKDNKKARIVCTLPKLGVVAADGTSSLVVQCDDFAPDMADLRVALSFAVLRPPEIALGKPSATTPDGVKIFLDSIYQGYENLECLMDGKLHEPGTTTFGCTWPSAETPVAHWMCFVLPRPRQVSGLEISWAAYQSHNWTSERYAIMTWDGKQWARAVKVAKNPEARTSGHSFPAVTTDRVLVWAPAGANHPQRPNLMWVSEVKLLP